MEDKKEIKEANVNEVINSQIALTMTRDNETETKDFLKKLGLPENADEDIALNALMFSTAHHIQNTIIHMKKDLILCIGSFNGALQYYKKKCEENGVNSKIKDKKENKENGAS